MTEQRLQQLLDHFLNVRILVVGDFFLDKYLVLDANLTEVSLETGLEAYQVVDKRLFPGAAGTVTSNLRALDAGVVYALGAIGTDGEGHELLRSLKQSGVVTDLVLQTSDLITPTYIKPMLRADGVERELNRIDIKNRHALPEELEQAIIANVQEMVPSFDAVIVADQVSADNGAVITNSVRDALTALSQAHQDVIFIADSRSRIGEFRGLWTKPNKFEAYRALHGMECDTVTIEQAARVGQTLARCNGRPVFITLAEDGILAVTEDRADRIFALRQKGSIDIVGAGDSVMAAITLALSSGATPVEAAIIGNIVASITVQQIGVTGTATRQQTRHRFLECQSEFATLRLKPQNT